MSTAVVKLGVGNTASVMFSLERIGAEAELTDDPARIAAAKRVILPGVGAAAHAMALLEQRGLRDLLRAYKRPLLGICLGQQLLYESSEEGDATGLGLLPGRVTRFTSPDLIIPHMGWSALTIDRAHALLDGVRTGDYVYFVHSYVCPLGEPTLAVGEYGQRFSAVVGKDNVFGCQFHPERSGAVGERIIENFLRLPC
jgi:imidazole glycerol-phosphate synthase subunit HisH